MSSYVRASREGGRFAMVAELLSPQDRSILVTGLPPTITHLEISTFFAREFGPLSDCDSFGADGSTSPRHWSAHADFAEIVGDTVAPVGLQGQVETSGGVVLHSKGANATAPHAYVTFHTSSLPGMAARAVKRCAAEGGCVIGPGVVCVVRLPKKPKAQRIAETAAIYAKKTATEESAKCIAWRWEMLDSFPRRATTLDQHAQMSQLSLELLELVDGYFTHRFPSNKPELAHALRWIWEMHPLSMRVKEFFETLEAFGIIAGEISCIRSRAAQEICFPCHIDGSNTNPLGDGWLGVDTIFDLACGHGLLGVLLAYQFPTVRVVCVDLERRACFDHYVAAFLACGVLDESKGQLELMQNLEFVEGDMASVEVPPLSFVVCVHACNEANQTAVEMARHAGAGYFAMPCCIPDGLYCVRGVRHVDIDARYAAMVGVMAGAFGAHSIVGIERRITNRNLAMLGGYPCDGRLRRPRRRKRQIQNSAVDEGQLAI